MTAAWRPAAYRRLLVLLAVALVFPATSAFAEVERHAILIAHNQGAKDEANLRYAESDASRMQTVLTSLGGFRSENVTLLSGVDAQSVRRALISINSRLRQRNGQAVLLVYYSGHADATALHLGGTELLTSELEELVSGSSADVRILILDSCRSGSLTRVKGGTRTAAFPVRLDEELSATGAVFFSASSANEDAQESDSLKSSFFTHYLISGLLGSADQNGDGVVVLSEAYRHAYDNTLRASSRSLAGTQHPTFRYALKGKHDVILTRPGMTKGRARIRLPHGHGYLLMRGSDAGDVVAEVGPNDKRRRLSLRPGRYFVRGRARDHLLEGHVQLSANGEYILNPAKLKRSDYARLVRKGGGTYLRYVHGPELRPSIRTSLGNSRGLCIGGALSYLRQYAELDVGARLHGCQARFENEFVATQLTELGGDVRLGRSVDLPWLTLSPYVQLGASQFRQRFETTGKAPARNSLAAHADAGVVLASSIGSFSYGIDVSAQSYGYRRDDSYVAETSIRGEAFLGWRWASY